VRLLIADSSDVFLEMLGDIFREEFDVRTCRDGYTALELLDTFQPQALIIRLELPLKDGLTVLEETANTPKTILALCNTLNPYIQQRCAQMGAQYLLRSPTVHTVRVRFQDILDGAHRENTPDLQRRTVRLLHILGFSPHLDGYRQLVVGIPLFCQEPDQHLKMELYPAIAKAFAGKDGDLVERSVRTAIDRAFKTKDPTVWAQYFPPDASGRLKRPTNKKFISTLAQLLQNTQ